MTDDDPADWAAPGAFEVAPGVHRVAMPLSDALRATNVYAIEAHDGLVLVDAGWHLPESREWLERALAQAGYRIGDVARCVVTHVHADHYTFAVALAREFGVRVALGVGEEPSLEMMLREGAPSYGAQIGMLRRCGAGALAGRLLAAGFDSVVDTSQWAEPDDWLADDARIELGTRDLHVVPTPGHTRGHVVFADPAAGLMFTGDHVLPHITPSIGFEAAPQPLPLSRYLASLARVRRMPDARLLPAHGHVGPSVHRRVDELLAHHEERLAACLQAVRAGCVSAHDTARALRWTRRERSFDELDLFNQMLAVLETAAHLDVLVAQGSLSVLEGDDTWRYVATLAVREGGLEPPRA